MILPLCTKIFPLNRPVIFGKNFLTIFEERYCEKQKEAVVFTVNFRVMIAKNNS